MGNFIDLTGKTFGKLKVIKQDFSKNDDKTYWLCKCSCTNKVIIRADRFKNNDYMQCPECSNKDSRVNLVGNKYGLLKVVKRLRDSGRGHWWLCSCDCKNKIEVSGNRLTSGRIEDCGCVVRAKNEYDLSGDYGIGYTNNGDSFYFDLEDYEKIKGFTWCMSTGYIMSNPSGNKMIQLHRVVVGKLKKGEIVDHINRNRVDNRKSNLRIVTEKENHWNTSLGRNNKSGFIGVSFNKQFGTWYSKIDVNYKQIGLGYYEEIEDAVRARLLAERQYYGVYSPQQHLFEQYGIPPL